MPTLPDYQPTQRQEPIPGVRVGEEAPLAAFGGGGAVAAETQAAGEFANDATRIQAQKEDKVRAEADRARLLGKRGVLNEWEYKNVYDPKTGALSKMGKNSFGTPDQLKADFDKFIAEQGKDLSNDRQREGFIEMAEARRDHIVRTVLDHVDKQTHLVEQSELLAGTESSKERAATDPSTVPTELAIIRDNVIAQRDSLGWGDQETAEQFKKQQSDLHARVVRRLATDQRDVEAKKYFDDHASEMTTQDYDRSETFVRDSSNLGEAQRQASNIMAPRGIVLDSDIPPGVPTEQEAIAQARKIKDAKVQELTIHQIKTRFDELHTAEKEQVQKDAQDAFEIVESKKTLDAIPLPLRQRLKPSAINQLETRAAQLRKKEDPVTDWDEYQKLRSMAANPDTRQEFLTIPAMNYRNYLGNTEFKEILADRDGLLKGDDKTLAKMRGYRTISGIVDGTIRQSDFAKDKPKQEVIERIMDEEVKAYQAANKGENPPDDWVQAKVDGLITKAVTEPRTFWFDKKAYGYETTKNLLETVDKIPMADRVQIEQAMKRTGEIPTRRRIIEVYMEKKARDAAGPEITPSRAQIIAPYGR